MRVFPIPAHSSFESLVDKAQFAEVCRTLSLPHPRTLVFRNVADLRNAIASGAVQLPFIVKPAQGSAGRGIRAFRSTQELAWLDQLSYEPLLVQAYIEGKDVCISVLCSDGSIAASATYRQSERGRVFETFEDARVHGLVQKVVEHFSYSGVAGFDLRIERTGKVWLIECNPRFTFNADMTMLAGINFVQLGLELPIGAPEIRAPQQRIRRAKLLKPWTLTSAWGPHGKHLLDDHWRLPLWMNLREAWAARWSQCSKVWQGLRAHTRSVSLKQNV